MSRNTEDPSNKPDYCNLTDSQWENTTESCRQTIIRSLNDPVSVKAYYRFQQTFKGYQRVTNLITDIAEKMLGKEVKGNYITDSLKELKESIDPLAQVIYRDVDNRIQELKEEKRNILGRLLQESVNQDDISEVRESILEELEDLEE